MSFIKTHAMRIAWILFKWWQYSNSHTRVCSHFTNVQHNIANLRSAEQIWYCLHYY